MIIFFIGELQFFNPDFLKFYIEVYFFECENPKKKLFQNGFENKFSEK